LAKATRIPKQTTDIMKPEIEDTDRLPAKLKLTSLA